MPSADPRYEGYATPPALIRAAIHLAGCLTRLLTRRHADEARVGREVMRRMEELVATWTQDEMERETLIAMSRCVMEATLSRRAVLS